MSPLRNLFRDPNDTRVLYPQFLPQQQQQQHRKYYGFMAHHHNNTTLECHYCGTSSNIEKDGTFKEWECTSCTAMNYHDHMGEVVDPPTEEYYTNDKQNTIQYAQTPRRPGPPVPRKPAEEPLFCSDCLRNQELFTSSLAQYLPDDDDPDYEHLYKNYYKYRRNLEKRYPQICTECEPRVTARMEQAGYIAQTDHLKRALEKSKKRRLIPGPSYKFSWVSLFDFGGLLLFYSGLSIQILWNVLGCFGSQTATTLASYTTQPQVSIIIPYFPVSLVVPSIVLRFCSLALPYLYSGSGVPSLAWTGLKLSGGAIWWNPVYKTSIRGFNNHITGYLDWYKMQAVSFVFRFVFYIIMKHGWFGYGDAVTVRAAHTFLIFITLITSFFSYKAINVDHSRIFIYTPEKLKKYVQPKPRSQDTTSDISVQLFARQPKSKPQPIYNAQPLFPQLAPKPPVKKNIDFNDRPPLLNGYIRELNSRKFSKPPQKNFQPNQSFSSSPRGPPSSPLAARDRDQLAALETSLQPSFGSPVRVPTQGQSQLYQSPYQESPSGMSSGMDWEPVESPVRAFQNPPKTRGNSFGHSAVVPPEQKGTFWYRVPPAPRSQNAKLRNPITPGFVSNSGEIKENFFQSMGGQKSVFDMGDANTSEEIEFAHPRFFPPQETADEGLAAMMNQSFSLKEKVEDEVHREEEEKGRRWWHFFFVVVVIALLAGYVHFFKTPGYEEIYEELMKLSGRGGEVLGEVLVGGGEVDFEGRRWDSEFR